MGNVKNARDEQSRWPLPLAIFGATGPLYVVWLWLESRAITMLVFVRVGYSCSFVWLATPFLMRLLTSSVEGEGEVENSFPRDPIVSWSTPIALGVVFSIATLVAIGFAVGSRMFHIKPPKPTNGYMGRVLLPLVGAVLISQLQGIGVFITSDPNLVALVALPPALFLILFGLPTSGRLTKINAQLHEAYPDADLYSPLNKPINKVKP